MAIGSAIPAVSLKIATGDSAANAPAKTATPSPQYRLQSRKINATPKVPNARLSNRASTMEVDPVAKNSKLINSGWTGPQKYSQPRMSHSLGPWESPTSLVR